MSDNTEVNDCEYCPFKRTRYVNIRMPAEYALGGPGALALPGETCNSREPVWYCGHLKIKGKPEVNGPPPDWCPLRSEATTVKFRGVDEH